MKRLRLPLLIYILLSQLIISNAKYIDHEILSKYPDKNYLENILEEYDNLYDGSIYSKLKNMDPQQLISLVENIAKIVQLGGKGIDYVVDAGKSLYQSIISLEGFSGNALTSTINILKIGAPVVFAAVAVGLLAKYKLDESNKYYNEIVCEIQKLIKHEKYIGIIEKYIGENLQNIIEKEISNKNLNNYIKDFLKADNIFEKLDYKFNEKIDSLNFILLGDTGVGKSTLINKILELTGDKAAYVNSDFADPTTMEFKKYRNETKKGLELIDSRGIESNENYNTKNFMGNFTNYFDLIRNESNSNFIYGILFICETDSFSEIDTLKDLKNMFNNKIPIKLLYLKEKYDGQAKRINNTIISKIEDIKPYFLKTTSNGDYEKNLNDFLKDIYEELNEKKLKDIYQYYYSLDIFDNFQSIMKNINAEKNFLDSLKKNIDPKENIINNLKFDLKFFLLNPDINPGNIKDDIKKIFDSFVKELNEDFKNIKYEDFSLKEYENRGLLDKIKEFVSNNHLPYDIISQGISQMINDFILNLILKTVQKEYFKNPIQIGNYPDFTNIKNSIEKNFIKVQDKINNKESNSYLYYFKYLLFAIFVVFVIIIIFYFCFCKKKEKKEEKIISTELIELNN